RSAATTRAGAAAARSSSAATALEALKSGGGYAAAMTTSRRELVQEALAERYRAKPGSAAMPGARPRPCPDRTAVLGAKRAGRVTELPTRPPSGPRSHVRGQTLDVAVSSARAASGTIARDDRPDALQAARPAAPGDRGPARLGP